MAITFAGGKLARQRRHWFIPFLLAASNSLFWFARHPRDLAKTLCASIPLRLGKTFHKGGGDLCSPFIFCLKFHLKITGDCVQLAGRFEYISGHFTRLARRIDRPRIKPIYIGAIKRQFELSLLFPYRVQAIFQFHRVHLCLPTCHSRSWGVVSHLTPQHL